MFQKKTDSVRGCKKGCKSRFSFFSLKKSALCMILFLSIVAGGVFLFAPQKEVEADIADPWYDTNWVHRKAITIDYTKVSITDQANFPVLISTTDASLKTVINGGKVANAEGYDIIFTSKDGTVKLDNEIESFDGSTGTVTMWVRIPNLSASVNTVIYVYYGNSNITTSQENKNGVWESNFKMVQHMNQDPSGAAPQMTDSTSNINNGTSAGVVTGDNLVAGNVGKALNFNGTDNYVNVGNMGTFSSNLNLMTFSAWFKTTSTASEALAGTLNISSSQSMFRVALNSAVNGTNSQGRIQFYLRSDSNNHFYGGVNTDTGITDGNWHNLTVVLDKANATANIYVDGNAQTVVYGASSNGTSWVNWTRNLLIGASNETNISYYFNGSIDEVRMSGNGFSANWIKTSYNNQSLPGSFLSLGLEESIPDQMNHLSVAGSGSQIAGDAQAIAITAAGISGSVYPAYTGDKTIVFSGASSVGAYIPTCTDKTGADIQFGNNTILTFTNGVANCNLKVYKGEAAVVSASDGTYDATGHALDINVNPAALSEFVMVVPVSAVSSTPFSLTLTAKDQYGNVTPNVSSTTTLSVSQGTVNPSTIVNTAFQSSGIYNNDLIISGVYTVANVTLTAQNGIINKSADLQVGTASAPVESSHSNSNTYANLNTITSLGNISFNIGYNTLGDIKWYKDGVLIQTDGNIASSSLTTAWTAVDYGKVKELRVNSTNEAGTSQDTVWKAEVEEMGTATISKNTAYPQPMVDGRNTLHVTSGWTNLPSLYLFGKQEDNAWIEYVKEGTYLIKTSILVDGAILYITSDVAREIRIQGLPSRTKIMVQNGGTMKIDKVKFYGWNLDSNNEIAVSDASPMIVSNGNNQMDITDSAFRHIMTQYSTDISAGDKIDNNLFYEGNAYNLLAEGSKGQIITNNRFYYPKMSNFRATEYGDTGGMIISGNKFFSSANSIGENVTLGQGLNFIGNEVTYSPWNLIEDHSNNFTKYNNLHDNGGNHNGFNIGPGIYTYLVSDYCHDITGFACFYPQTGTNVIGLPHHVYIINAYAKDSPQGGIGSHGAWDSYYYNYTSSNAHDANTMGEDNVFYRKSSMSNNDQGTSMVDGGIEIGFDYVKNLYVIDSQFSQNTRDYWVVSEIKYENHPIIWSINAFRRNGDTIQVPVTNFGANNHNGEVRNYAYLDTLVQNSTGVPIQGAVVTVEPLTDVNYPAIKVNLPPPPPELNAYPAEPLPIPSVNTFDSITTGSDGHTSSPNYGWSNNTEPTAALLFEKDNAGVSITNSVSTTNYQYRITATLGAETVSTVVIPDISWYREDPTIASKTVVLTFDKEAGKSALNVNSGTGSGIYTPGEIKNISIGTTPAGKVFDKWIGDTTGIANVTQSATTITVQSTDASISPYFKDITYHLTVVGGTGTGDYPAGKIVVADAAPTNGAQVFYKWTGETASVVSPAVYSSTINMPASDITVTATYRNPTNHSCHLTVADGEGTDFYAPGDNVTIKADAALPGKRFDHWAGDIENLDNITTETATLSNISATYLIVYPVYAATSETAHDLTVTSGTGTGSYEAAQEITVTANAALAGQIFDQWTGDTAYITTGGVNSSSVTVTMPASAIGLTATYREMEVVATPTFLPAAGTYTAAQEVTIASTTPDTAIYYTTNGDTPTESSTLYAGAFTVSATSTVKAIAIKAGFANSAQGSAAYVINIPSSNKALSAFSFNGLTPAVTGTINEGVKTVALTVPFGTNVTALVPTISITGASVSPNTAVAQNFTSPVTYTVTAADASTQAYTVTVSVGASNDANLSALSISSGTLAPVFSADTTSYTASVANGVSGLTVTPATAGASITVNGTAVVSGAVSNSIVLAVGANAISIIVTAPDTTTTKTYTLTVTRAAASSGGGGGGGSSTHPKPKVNKAEIVSVDGNRVNLSFSVTDAAEMNLSSSTTFTSSNWEKYQATKAYTKTDNQSKIYLKFRSSYGVVSDMSELTIPSSTIPTLPPTDNPNTASPYPTGTLIKLTDSFRVYVMIDNKKKWIPTPEVFQQLGYKWTEVKVLTPDQLKLIPDFEDNLIRALGNYKVYLVVNGVKRHIPNPEVFLNYGFLWTDVVDVPQETVDKYKVTYLIKESGKDGVYYINPNEIRKLIPTTEVFNSYNDKVEDIQVISTYEMNYYPNSKLIKLSGGNDVYLIEGTSKKRIPSPQIFVKYQLDWNHVMSVNRTEFDFYQDWGILE